MARLAAFGSNCIDLYVKADGNIPCAGGGPVNMAVQAVKCGVSASYTGAIGSDAFGEWMLAVMRKNGVDVSRVRRMDGQTAVSEVRMEGNERILGDYDPGVLEDFRLSEEDLRDLAEADVCVTDLWGRQEDFFAKLKEYGACTAFDSADRPDDPAAETVIPYTDLFFFSADRDSAAVREKMEQLRNKGVRTAVAMLGINGSLALDEDGWHACGVVPCAHVIDTLGAGDSYIGAFLSAYIEKHSAEECMRRGAACASQVLGFHGAFAQEEQ